METPFVPHELPGNYSQGRFDWITSHQIELRDPEGKNVAERGIKVPNRRHLKLLR